MELLQWSECRNKSSLRAVNLKDRGPEVVQKTEIETGFGIDGFLLCFLFTMPIAIVAFGLSKQIIIEGFEAFFDFDGCSPFFVSPLYQAKFPVL